VIKRGDLRLVVGLGNPGEKYASTRHNVGFMALELLTSREGGRFKAMPKLQGDLADVGSGATRLRLLMPQTYMNDSGRSIRAALDWFDLGIDQLIVLVDDMDLPLGRLRLRAQGGAGGHNGLKSTIQHLGTQEFARLRIGIGAPGRNPEERRARTVSHVLGQFSRAEEPLLQDVLREVLKGLDHIQRQGLDRAGNAINAVNLAPAAEADPA
jgi:PTH1 family peptidyl-tRNA hydrolase